MPPLPSVPNVIRARVFFTLNGKPTQGVRLFFRYSGTHPTTTALNTLAHDLYTAFVTATIAAVLGNDNKLTGVVLEDLNSTTGAVGSYFHTTNGTAGAEYLPPEVAFLVSNEIARRYRGGHSRTYWPFGTAANLSAPNSWAATFVTLVHTKVQAVYTTFIGKVAGGCTITAHVNVSYYSGFTSVQSPTTHRWRNIPTVRGAPLVDTITAVVARVEPASFRRRRLASP